MTVAACTAGSGSSDSRFSFVSAARRLTRLQLSLLWLLPVICIITSEAFAAEPPRVILDSTELAVPSSFSKAKSAMAGDSASELRIPFGVFDPDGQRVTVTAASGNQSIIANRAIRIEGEGEQRTLVIDEVKRNGQVSLTIAVHDGGQGAMERIELSVGQAAQR